MNFLYFIAGLATYIGYTENISILLDVGVSFILADLITDLLVYFYLNR